MHVALCRGVQRLTRASSRDGFARSSSCSRYSLRKKLHRAPLILIWIGLCLSARAQKPELVVQTGHTNFVTSVAFSPDRHTLASGSWDNTVKLWDVATQRELRTLAGHTEWVKSVVFSPDGRMLASGSDDHSVKLWEVATGHELRTLAGHTSNVNSVVFSPDGRTLASGSSDNTVKLWDVATGRELRILAGHTDCVSSVAFSPDGRTLASGSSDKAVKLWDVTTGRELRTLTGHTGGVGSVAFSPDGRMLASGSSDFTVKLWDIATGRELRTLAGHDDVVESVAFSPDGYTLALGNLDKTVTLWEVATGRELRTLTGHTSYVTSVAFSPEGRTLASGSYDGSTRLWDTTKGRELARVVALDKNDWAVVDSVGRFDASPGGMELMHWTVGNEIITLDQLKARYWEPGLLAKILGFNKQPTRDASAFNSVKLYPAVQFEAPAPGNKQLKLALKNRGGGIGEVEVLVNGKEVVGDARGSLVDRNASEANLTVDLSGSDYVPGRANEIRVVTRNQEGYLASRGVEVIWNPEGARDDSPPELWAIVGGISTYASPEVKLRYAAKDAVDMTHALQLSAQKLFGVDKVHLTLLTTEESPTALAPTRENFEKAFERARKAKPQDILLVYLAGHGVALHGETDLYAYLTADARSANVSDFSDPALRAQWTITSEALTDWIKQIPALKQVMILDTCEAGAAKTKLVERRAVPADQVRALDRMKDRTGFHVLMGAAVDKPSYEASSYNQGLLTYALLLGMQGAALRNGEFIDVSQWFQYAADEVPKLARGIGQSQNPIVAAPSGTSFDVGAVDDTVRSAIHLAKAIPFLLRPMLLDPDQQDDELGLNAALRKRLDDESNALRRGTEAPLQAVFVDSDELPGAIRVGGTYTVQDSTVAVTLTLWRDKQKLGTLQVHGQKDNLEGLVQSLVAAIEGVLLQLPRAN